MTPAAQITDYPLSPTSLRARLRRVESYGRAGLGIRPYPGGLGRACGGGRGLGVTPGVAVGEGVGLGVGVVGGVGVGVGPPWKSVSMLSIPCIQVPKPG